MKMNVVQAIGFIFLFSTVLFQIRNPDSGDLPIVLFYISVIIFCIGTLIANKKEE